MRAEAGKMHRKGSNNYLREWSSHHLPCIGLSGLSTPALRVFTNLRGGGTTLFCKRGKSGSERSSDFPNTTQVP